MTLTNSTGSMTSKISSSSLRNITSFGLCTLGQYFRRPVTTWGGGGGLEVEGGKGEGRVRGEGESEERGVDREGRKGKIITRGLFS